MLYFCVCGSFFFAEESSSQILDGLHDGRGPEFVDVIINGSVQCSTATCRTICKNFEMITFEIALQTSLQFSWRIVVALVEITCANTRK